MELRKYTSIFIMFTLLVISTRRVRCDEETTESEPTDEDYSYEGDEDAVASYENDTEKQTDHEMHVRSGLQTTTPSSTQSTTPTTTTSTETFPALMGEPINIHNKELRCPEKCLCVDDYKLINCSRRQLQEIPENLPKNVETLDLSHNQLKHLNIGALKDCKSLRELLLANNQIETIIDKTSFAYLEELETIDLKANKLNALNGDEFVDTRKLTKLVLSHNLNIIETNKPLVNVTDLETLELVACNITELSDNTFEYLSTLTELNLKDNQLDQHINLEAFRPFVNLRSFQVTDIAQHEIRDLCDILTAIDVINMDKYDVSCFQLVSGASFEESTVKAGIATEVSIEEPFDDYLNSVQVTENVVKTSTAPIANNELTSAKRTDSNPHEPMIVPKTIDSEQQSHKMSQNATNQVNGTAIGDIESVATDDDTARVNISKQSINTILIAIIIVALTGLLIGIICRIDCCGIKTRMCRSRRRPAPTDQVRPAEEVPLNKV